MNPWQDFPLEGTTAVLFDFGRTPDAYLLEQHSCADFDLIRCRLGVEVVHREMDLLLRDVPEEETAAQDVAGRWMSDARSIDHVAPEVLLSCARLFVAARAILDPLNARAMAIHCHQLLERGLRIPCSAMAELYRQGIVAACEADLNAMLTIMLAAHLSARPGFMGNTLAEAGDTIEIDHCVAPSQMVDGLCGYEFTAHHASPSQPGVMVDLPKTAPATLLRISADLDTLHYAVGEVADSHHDGVCCNTVAVRLEQRDQFWVDKLPGHYIVVCADLEGPLQAWAEQKGIAAVRSGPRP